MNKPDLPRPTDAELEILNVLWQQGASTVREIHEIISRRKPTVYTTILKLLQIMNEKGLVERDTENRAHVYRARFTKNEMQRQLVNDLLARAFDGSAAQLVMQVLAAAPARDEELAQIRYALREAEDERRRRSFNVIL
jgi:BlaI family penicillinase repressor